MIINVNSLSTLLLISLSFVLSYNSSQTTGPAYRSQIIDRLKYISKNLRQNQTLMDSLIPPIVSRAYELISKRNKSDDLTAINATRRRRKHKNKIQNDQKYLQPITRKRKFKIDTDQLNKPDLGRSTNLIDSKKTLNNSNRRRSKVVRPIIKLDDLNSKDPFGLKKNHLNGIEEEEYCYQQIELTTLPIRILSPNYLSKGIYPSNTNCSYNLTSLDTPYEEQIKLNIINLEIEDSKHCEHDFLTILNSSIKFCGDLKNKVFYLNQSNAILNFRSDITTELKGFEIEVSNENKYCKSSITLHDYETTLTSPNFPNNYPDSIDCWTLINGEYLQLDYVARNPDYNDELSITFTFDELDMEPDALCNIDYVELFELNLETLEPQLSLGRFCELGKYVRIVGDKKNKKNQLVTIGNKVHTRNPYLYLHFKSDKLVNSRGFKAKIELKAKQSNRINHTCEWKADHVNKKIISPSFPHPYPSNFDCSILIEAPDNQRIQLTFERFILEPDNECRFDRFSIYEPSIKQKTERKKRSPIGTQKTNLDHVDLRRFLIGTQVIRSSFNEQSLNGSSSIKSNQETKELKFKKNDNKKLKSIDLLTNTLENGKPDKIFCGKKEANSKYLSKGSKLILRFMSDDFGEYVGFAIDYKFLTKEEANRLDDEQKRKDQAIERNDEIKLDEIEYDLEPKDAEVSLGSSFLLRCKPKGYSKLNLINNQFNQQNQSNETNKFLKWYKDDQELIDNLNEDRTVLLIREFQVSSIGNYKCKYGHSSRSAWLKIKNETDCIQNEIIFQRRPQDLITTEGEYPILECIAVVLNSNSLHNKLKIQWLHNEKPINFDLTNKHQQLLPNNYLLISEIKKEDSGFYYCQVQIENEPKCQKSSIASVQVKSKQNVEMVCGRTLIEKDKQTSEKQKDHGKIVGGTESIRGSHPWQVMFWDSKRSTFCGGSVLNERWLATAAHCFKPNPSSSNPPPPLSQIIVRLGKHDQNIKEDLEINTQINEVYLHPQYNPETFDNDLALIQVKDHITFNEFVQPICLGTSELAEKNFFSEYKGHSANASPKMGHVSGWGQVRENGPQPRFLQELKVPLRPLEECKQSTTFKVTSNMFCAGYGEDTIGDSCKGDSGSPFSAKLDDSRHFLVGIVSWGEGCGKSGKFGFYTKVNNYLDWINALIQL